MIEKALSWLFKNGTKVIILPLAKFSYSIALIIGTSGLILYIFGYKKAGKLPAISIGAYTLIQAIASCFR